MPSYERELDLVQGYNFKKDIQKPIGFLTFFKVGLVNLPADQMVSSPFTDKAAGLAVKTELSSVGAGSLNVVSVLKKIKWDLGDTDPIEFEGTVSVTGKQMIMSLLYATMIDIQVNISFVVYEFDPLQRQYFVAFSNTVTGPTTDVAMASTAGVLGLIKKDGDNLALTVSPTPSTDVQSPENYDFAS